jgi:hypothetical protein
VVAYFGGLARAVGGEGRGDIAAHRFSARLDGDLEHGWVGTTSAFDAFKSQKPILLHLRVKAVVCHTTVHRPLVFLAWPGPSPPETRSGTSSIAWRLRSAARSGAVRRGSRAAAESAPRRPDEDLAQPLELRAKVQVRTLAELGGEIGVLGVAAGAEAQGRVAGDGPAQQPRRRRVHHPALGHGRAEGPGQVAAAPRRRRPWHRGERRGGEHED